MYAVSFHNDITCRLSPPSPARTFIRKLCADPRAHILCGIFYPTSRRERSPLADSAIHFPRYPSTSLSCMRYARFLQTRACIVAVATFQFCSDVRTQYWAMQVCAQYLNQKSKATKGENVCMVEPPQLMKTERATEKCYFEPSVVIRLMGMNGRRGACVMRVFQTSALQRE